jgi:hypothetical protein
LTPSKWYDSNQRGLQLPEIYSKPRIENLERISKQYYQQLQNFIKAKNEAQAQAPAASS